MGKFKSFEEITSWQKSRLFNKRIYEITENISFKKDFDLVRQIRRASISISSKELNFPIVTYVKTFDFETLRLLKGSATKWSLFFIFSGKRM